jgi:hypothetical protein
MLKNIAVPSDRNVAQEEAEKKLKYNSLRIEIQRTRNMKCFVTTGIMGVAGIFSRGLKNTWKQ